MTLSLTFTFAERHFRQALLLMLDAAGRLTDSFLGGVIFDMILNGFEKHCVWVSQYSLNKVNNCSFREYRQR
jgi:hypothetical protein